MYNKQNGGVAQLVERQAYTLRDPQIRERLLVRFQSPPLKIFNRKVLIMSEVLLVNEDTFEVDVLKSDLPVVVDFFANWCVSCKPVLAGLSKFAADMDGVVRVAKVDIDQSPNIANQYKVMSIPSLLLFKSPDSVTFLGAGNTALNNLEDKVKSLI